MDKTTTRRAGTAAIRKSRFRRLPSVLSVLTICCPLLFSNALFAVDSGPSTDVAADIDAMTGGCSKNRLATPVRLPLERTLPGPITDWTLLGASSGWEEEYLLSARRLNTDGYRYAQRAGRACKDVKPWWLLANRRTGQGVGISLGYMGNWDFSVEPRGQQIVVRLATSPADIQPVMTIHGLSIPGALVSEFTGHWDYGAQPIVRFIREKLLRDLGPQWPLVQYNNYYDGGGVLTQRQLIVAARAAAGVGCELFTVDAGWYGEGLDSDWSAALGDWQVNRSRLPDGLEAVADEVHRLGMKFGLWFEIECAHPSSQIARAHPDWFLTDAQGKRLGTRDVLDFGKPEVVAHAKSVINRFMEKCRLDYVKMDFNADPAIENSQLAQADDPLCRHYAGLVELWTYMHATYPSLVIENCSSGSLRHELTTAALTDTHWISDNIRNDANLWMIFGATYLFPPSTCSHWTTWPDPNNPTIDLDAQFAINMMGHFGMSGKIASWDADTTAIAKNRIAQYKRIRPVIRNADVFHLTAQRPGFMQAALYLDAATGRALLFAFHGGDPEMKHTIHPRGLDPNRHYRLSVLVGAGQLKAPNVGRLQLPGATASVIVGKLVIEEGITMRFDHSGAVIVVEIDPAGE